VKKLFFGWIVLFTTSVSHAGPVSSFNDIEYWVGSGSNQAAIVFDWVQDSSLEKSWVWGYRWNGTATGEDMFLAVVKADPRLYARIGEKDSWGLPLYGIGYDLNHNGSFGISDGTPFNAYGIAVTSSHDGAVAVDSGDLYKEGWFSGFWNLEVSSDANPFGAAHWSPSYVGMSGTYLSNGDWNAFTFETDFGFDSYPENPYAASLPEPSTLILLAIGCLVALAWRLRKR
jgi:hypothetical protein